MKTFVINLDESTERWAEFVRQNEGLEYERFSAIKGEEVLDASSPYRKWFADSLRYTKGAYGCAASHISLWSLCAELGEPITIAEDDAIFIHDFNARSLGALRQLRESWDIVLWGWNFDSICCFQLPNAYSLCVASFSQKTMRQSISQFKSADYQPVLFRLLRAFALVGYSVSPGRARKMIDMAIPVRPIRVYFPRLNRHISNSGIDISTNAIYPDIDAFCSFPPFVVSKNERNISTIQTGTRVEKDSQD